MENHKKKQLASEVVEQLESLQEHCESFIDDLDFNSPWQKDVAALNFAIETIRRTYSLAAK